MLFCINVGFIGLKVQTHFSQDVRFICCNMFYKVIKFKLIEHVSLYLNIYHHGF